MSDREIIRESADGRYRAVLVRDDYPHEPDFDGGTPLFRIESRWGHYSVEALNREAKDYVDAYEFFATLDQNGHSTDIFERYLRIFHGTKAVSSYGPNNYTDAEYFTFDTDAWAKQVGCPDGEPRETAARSGLEEWVNYLEGDVYFIDIEEIQTGACGHDGCEDHTGWESVDSCGGFYGDNQYTRVDAVDYHFGHYFEEAKAA